MLAASAFALTPTSMGHSRLHRAAHANLHLRPTMSFEGLVEKIAEEDKKAYEANPIETSGIELPEGCQGAKDVFMIFHGAGGPDRETDDLQERVLAQDKASGFERTVCLFDWQPWFSRGQQRNLNSYHGQAVGRKLGQLLAAQAPDLQTLHIVGTSAGAWPANELCTAYVESTTGQAQRATVLLSLTDPFTARSDRPFADPWGMRNFGRDADFAEQYLNTDDIAPSTNEPLPLCYCYDVTTAAERASFPLPGGGSTGNALLDAGMMLLGYHNWPMGYLARHYETRLNANGRLIIPTHDELPRGAVNMVL